MTCTHNEQVNKDIPDNNTSNTHQNNVQDNVKRKSSLNQIAVNNEQKDNPNYMPIHSIHKELNENTTTCPRYGRTVKKTKRINILLVHILTHTHTHILHI